MVEQNPNRLDLGLLLLGSGGSFVYIYTYIRRDNDSLDYEVTVLSVEG
jgi:hypothetical protein